MGKLGLPGGIGKLIVTGIKSNVIYTEDGSGVTIDDIAQGEGTWLSVSATTEQDFWGFSGVIGGGDDDAMHVGDNVVDVSDLTVPNGTFAHLRIVLLGDGDALPTALGMQVTCDGVPVMFNSGQIVVALPLPTTSVTATADPGQEFTSASTVIFSIHVEGNPFLVLGSFDINLSGYF